MSDKPSAPTVAGIDFDESDVPSAPDGLTSPADAALRRRKQARGKGGAQALAADFESAACSSRARIVARGRVTGCVSCCKAPPHAAASRAAAPAAPVRPSGHWRARLAPSRAGSFQRPVPAAHPATSHPIQSLPYLTRPSPPPPLRYKQAAVAKATGLGLTGFARAVTEPTVDGSPAAFGSGCVELFAQGPVTQVEEFVQWASEGPPSAQIDDCDVSQVEALPADDGEVGFVARDTLQVDARLT